MWCTPSVSYHPGFVGQSVAWLSCVLWYIGPMDELSDGQQSELADALRALETELQSALDLATDGSKPVQLDQQSVGRVSRMDAMQQQQLAASSRRSVELRLRQVRAALSALDEDTYGLCKLCEEPIGYRRLKARPETPLCLGCQGQRETQ